MEILTITGGSLYTNCYMVWEQGDSCVLIDPGFDAETILESVHRHGKTVAAILLTHGHFDHVGGVKELVRQTGCPVYLHEDEQALPSQLTLGTLPNTHSYQEGDTFTLAGISFHVLHTPGHSPGSVCLVTEDALFAGDTLFAGSCGRTDLPGGDYRKMRHSLGRLARLEGNFQVLPGHGSASTLDEERRSNPFLQGVK